MTIGEAIAAADQISTNLIAQNTKKQWLSELDGRIYNEIIDPYGKNKEFKGYTSSSASTTKLLVPYPYDSIYVIYLEQEIALRNAEIARYNNARTVFNERLEAYRRWYIRMNRQDTPNISFPVRRY